MGERADFKHARGGHVESEAVVGGGIIPADGFEKGRRARLGFFFTEHIKLVEHEPARFVKQLFIVFAQFVHNRQGFVGGAHGFVKRGQIHHVQQQAGAREVF